MMKQIVAGTAVAIAAASAFPQTTALPQAVAALAEDEALPEKIDAAFAARYAAWKTYIGAYRPDYSDSSDCLLPPEGNRLEKPFAVVSGGKPAAEIVLASEAREDVVLRQAALELQKHIKMLTGVEIKINDGWGVMRKQPDGLNRICLGKRLVPSYRDSGWFANGGWNEILAATSGGRGRDGGVAGKRQGNDCPGRGKEKGVQRFRQEKVGGAQSKWTRI